MRRIHISYTARPHSTVGFHNFNLRIFNLRVSNPNKLSVDVFLTRCGISMCQGLGPKKHDEISEIDRTSRIASRKHSFLSMASTNVRIPYGTQITNCYLLSFTGSL